MDPNNTETIREIMRMTRENNQMLHAMRRNAFLGGLFKFIIYAILFAAPIWFYMTYLSNTVDNLIIAINKVQGTTVAAQTNFNGLAEALKNIQSHLPVFMQGASTSASSVKP